jgi:hypothetical protein
MQFCFYFQSSSSNVSTGYVRKSVVRIFNAVIQYLCRYTWCRLSCIWHYKKLPTPIHYVCFDGRSSNNFIWPNSPLVFHGPTNFESLQMKRNDFLIFTDSRNLYSFKLLSWNLSWTSIYSECPRYVDGLFYFANHTWIARLSPQNYLNINLTINHD